MKDCFLNQSTSGALEAKRVIPVAINANLQLIMSVYVVPFAGERCAAKASRSAYAG
jgi:hypothetical protein